MKRSFLVPDSSGLESPVHVSTLPLALFMLGGLIDRAITDVHGERIRRHETNAPQSAQQSG